MFSAGLDFLRPENSVVREIKIGEHVLLIMDGQANHPMLKFLIAERK
jgi:hypothetical protein